MCATHMLVQSVSLPFFGAQSIYNANKTFVEFIDWLGKQNLHRCGNPHYGYQFKEGDYTKFEIFRLENFTAFVDRFNEFGGHQFKISDFGAAHIKQKIQTDKKFHNVTFRQMFDDFNYKDDRARKEETKQRALLPRDRTWIFHAYVSSFLHPRGARFSVQCFQVGYR